MSQKIRHLTYAFALAGLLLYTMPVTAQNEDNTRKARYDVQELLQDVARPVVTLPDISAYTIDNIGKRIPAVAPGKVAIQPLPQIASLWKFSTPDMLAKFTRLQNGKVPVAIVIQSGVFDLDTLFVALNDPAAIEKTADAYLLHRPLYISAGATLVLRGSVEKHQILRLSADNGAFIVNGGNFFALHAELAAWDVQAQTYASFKDARQYRPFYAAWNASHTYAGDTDFHSLGYDESKAYGVSLSSDGHLVQKNPTTARPDGWFVGCHFEDNYYAFYSYEAENVAIIDNVFEKNIVYGIDPHDRSRRLVIAGNKTFDTVKKHGIIISRDVTDSWIFDNDSYHNHSSGIMLDRNSHNNVVANNLSHDNGAYGIALMESPDNILSGNKIYNNNKEGIKIRNSWEIFAVNNDVVKNQGTGVSVVKTDISKDARRDFAKDPYVKRVGVTLADGTIGNNGKSDIAFEGIEKLVISNVTMQRLSQNSLQGNLSLSGRDKILTLLTGKKSLALVPNE